MMQTAESVPGKAGTTARARTGPVVEEARSRPEDDGRVGRDVLPQELHGGDGALDPRHLCVLQGGWVGLKKGGGGA
jgi:hypothetical protein